MFECIVVPVDGSPPSEAALALAVAFARGTGRRIVCTHAVDLRGVLLETAGFAYPSDPSPLIAALTEQGEALLAAAAGIVRAAGVPVETRLSIADAVPAIGDAVSACSAELIVMGTHGRKGLSHAFLGSTAEGVLRTSLIPVMTVRDGCVRPGGGRPIRRLLVAIDESDAAKAAAGIAIELAAAEQSRLFFCTVVVTADLLDKAAVYGYDPRPFLESMHAVARDLVESALARANERGVDADTCVVQGEPVEALVKAATRLRTDAIVTGTHGRGGVQRLLLGSVAEHVLRRSAVPVLTVRAQRVAHPVAARPQTLA